MATIKFKTNAKCGGCVAAIGAKLNTLMASDDWSIDLADPNKVLEVKVDLAPAIVIAAVKEAGFKAEQLYVYILPCFDPCTTEKTLAAVRSWCDLFAYCGNLYALYVAGPPAGRLLGLVTIRRHMDRGSGRCLAEFQEDEKERPSENSLLSGNGLGSHNCF